MDMLVLNAKVNRTRCGVHKHDTPEECARSQLPPKCCNCGGEHLPSSPTCPTYLRYKQIYAYAAIENVSYSEARSKFGTPSPPASSSLNSFHHKDFPVLQDSARPSQFPRALTSYHDLYPSDVGNYSFGPASSYRNPNLSYADIARTVPPSSEAVSHPQRDEATRHYLEDAVGRHIDKNDKNGGSSVRHTSDSYSKLRESHNSLLYASNGRMPNSPPSFLTSLSLQSSFFCFRFLPSFPPSSSYLPPPFASSSSPPSFPSFSFSPPSPPSSTVPYELTNVIRCIISFLLQMLSKLPEEWRNSSLGTGIYSTLSTIQTFLNLQ